MTVSQERAQLFDQPGACFGSRSGRRIGQHRNARLEGTPRRSALKISGQGFELGGSENGLSLRQGGGDIHVVEIRDTAILVTGAVVGKNLSDLLSLLGR